MKQSMHTKPVTEDECVFFFEKPIEQKKNDMEQGVSRFGGELRHPNYTRAYLRAARILIENSTNNDELDQIGLPVFFLLRHSLELFIKSILNILYDMSDIQKKLKFETTYDISKEKSKRLYNSHSLGGLNDDLKDACLFFRYEFNKDQLNELIDEISRYESNPSWSRYAKSKEKRCHLDKEAVVPIVGIYRKIKIIIDSLDCRLFPFPDKEFTLLEKIYDDYNSLINTFEYVQNK